MEDVNFRQTPGKYLAKNPGVVLDLAWENAFFGVTWKTSRAVESVGPTLQACLLVIPPYQADRLKQVS